MSDDTSPYQIPPEKEDETSFWKSDTFTLMVIIAVVLLYLAFRDVLKFVKDMNGCVVSPSSVPMGLPAVSPG